MQAKEAVRATASFAEEGPWTTSRGDHGDAPVVIVEGYDMLAERYLRRKFREGLQRGREEGRVEGRVEANETWQAWYHRWQEAQEEGRPFDEPPPSSTSISDSKT